MQFLMRTNEMTNMERLNNSVHKAHVLKKWQCSCGHISKCNFTINIRIQNYKINYNFTQNDMYSIFFDTQFIDRIVYIKTFYFKDHI